MRNLISAILQGTRHTRKTQRLPHRYHEFFAYHEPLLKAIDNLDWSQDPYDPSDKYVLVCGLYYLLDNTVFKAHDLIVQTSNADLIHSLSRLDATDGHQMLHLARIFELLRQSPVIGDKDSRIVCHFLEVYLYVVYPECMSGLVAWTPRLDLVFTMVLNSCTQPGTQVADLPSLDILVGMARIIGLIVLDETSVELPESVCVMLSK
jgi:hypothetical protein